MGALFLLLNRTGQGAFVKHSVKMVRFVLFSFCDNVLDGREAARPGKEDICIGESVIVFFCVQGLARLPGLFLVWCVPFRSRGRLYRLL